MKEVKSVPSTPICPFQAQLTDSFNEYPLSDYHVTGYVSYRDIKKSHMEPVPLELSQARMQVINDHIVWYIACCDEANIRSYGDTDQGYQTQRGMSREILEIMSQLKFEGLGSQWRGHSMSRDQKAKRAGNEEGLKDVGCYSSKV